MSSITHVKKLDQGKQGITGLVKYDGVLCVYKISQYMNYLPNHEYLILKGLGEIIPSCPHFCNVVALRTLPIHPNFRAEEQDPFADCARPIYLDVLFMEYIAESVPLYDLIQEPTTPMEQIMSCIRQTLVAIMIAQEKKRFVHYDLHALNILIRDVNINDVFLYVLDEETALYIPSYGFNSVIIDFGFSSTVDLKGNPSFLSLAYTDSGYLSPAYDTLADAKVFLVSLAKDFSECRPRSSQASKFIKIVHNLFSPLRLAWSSGWDKTDGHSIVDSIFRYIDNPKEESILFSQFPQLCVDILHSLIQLPLSTKTKATMDELKHTYNILVQHFRPIEDEIRDVFFSMYAFRNLVDCAREVRTRYYNGEQEAAVAYFRNEFMTRINRTISFCMFTKVDFDILLCALFTFSEQLETQLARMLAKLVKTKQKQYEQLELQRVQDMYTVFSMNFEDSYQFSSSTKIHVLDTKRNETTVIDCHECDTTLLDKINSLSNPAKGTFLLNCYKSLTSTPTS